MDPRPEIDPVKFGFKSLQETGVSNKHRYRKDHSWLDAKAKENPRRSNPSTAPCNWLEEVLNSWNTNQSCTIDTGRVINYNVVYTRVIEYGHTCVATLYLTNYLAKKEVTAKDVSRAMRDAAKYFKGREHTSVTKLLKRALHHVMVNRCTRLA